MTTFNPRYYEILGVARDADADTISGAHRKLARETHPDLHPEREEEFKLISQAYATLNDTRKRFWYNKALEAWDRGKHPHQTGAPRRPRPPHWTQGPAPNGSGAQSATNGAPTGPGPSARPPLRHPPADDELFPGVPKRPSRGDLLGKMARNLAIVFGCLLVLGAIVGVLMSGGGSHQAAKSTTTAAAQPSTVADATSSANLPVAASDSAAGGATFTPWTGGRSPCNTTVKDRLPDVTMTVLYKATMPGQPPASAKLTGPGGVFTYTRTGSTFTWTAQGIDSGHLYAEVRTNGSDNREHTQWFRVVGLQGGPPAELASQTIQFTLCGFTTG